MKGFFERFGRHARPQPAPKAPAFIRRVPQTQIRSPEFHALMDGAVHAGTRPRVQVAFQVTDCEVCGRHLFDKLVQLEEKVARLRRANVVVPTAATAAIEKLRRILRGHRQLVDLGGVLYHTQADHWQVVERFGSDLWTSEGVRMPTPEDLTELALRYGSRFCEPFTLGSINAAAF